MSDDINQLVQAASTSLFSPESLDDIRSRLSFIEASECYCGVGPHENAVHDLIKDDVPVLLDVIDRLSAELKAARAENERLRAATDFADSILSLLRYRGLVDSENNRRDVQKASEMLERLRR